MASHGWEGSLKDGIASFYGRAASLRGSVLLLARVRCVGAVDGAVDPPAYGPTRGSPGGERCERENEFVEWACDYPRGRRGGERSPADVS
jgi:hypothetical protein